MEISSFKILVEDSDSDGPNSKTDEMERESLVLLIFVLWWCLNCRWVRGGGVGQKVLFRAR